MPGLNKHTGKQISGIDLLIQYISDILTTPKGSRTMRAEYGSNLYQYVDRNITEELIVDITAEVKESLSPLVNIFELKKVNITVDKTASEKISVEIIGNYLETGEQITLNNVIIN